MFDCPAMKTLSLLLVFALFFSACSMKPKAEIIYPKERKFDVSVYEGNKQIKNPSASLVHRYQLSPSVLNKLGQDVSKSLPFSFRTVNDAKGMPKGIKLSSHGITSGKISMGLQHNDIVTAINKTHVTKESQLSILTKTLKADSKATLTLERKGKPHKIYYKIEG